MILNYCKMMEDCRKDLFCIRKIREDDIARLAVLEKCIFPDPWTENGLKDSLCQKHTVLLGIWEDYHMAGYVIMYYVLDEGEIARIAVEPALRRRGAAGFLLRRLEEICGEKGILRLMLEVRKGNAAAVSFYKKHGFTEDGVRKGYYTNPCEDAVLMSKELKAEL